MRLHAAGEVTPEELQRENAIVQSADDILYVDFYPGGTAKSLEQLLKYLKETY
ncbi:MAG TPA: hypothetical protein VMP11_11190 [Verrucomicrobiae bacterium]|nr:hypothetical protein [Verrucomicrobiae bacterium]